MLYVVILIMSPSFQLIFSLSSNIDLMLDGHPPRYNQLGRRRSGHGGGPGGQAGLLELGVAESPGEGRLAGGQQVEDGQCYEGAVVGHHRGGGQQLA